MTPPGPSRRFRFGIFEADASTGELRRHGIRVRLNAQPFQVLCLLLERPGDLLTREQIAQHLWPEGTFVDADHGVHSAVNRIREAIGDSASSPRFIETLARRGYRFIAPVERIDAPDGSPAPDKPQEMPPPNQALEGSPPSDADPDSEPVELKEKTWRILATPQDLPRVPWPIARNLFLLLQVMYLGFYIGALANLAEIADLLSALSHPRFVFVLLIATAAILIPLRAFVFSAVLFHAPRVQQKFLTLWPFLLVLDEIWALSPFLLLHHINFGLALSATALLVYSPFAQRSLVLMGAGLRRDRPS